MYNDIIDQTINAGLSRSEESMVLRLLHVADPKTGKVALLMDDFLHLCDLQSKGAATRYLCTLKQAGIISYHTDMYRMDAQVFVEFRGWGIEVEEEDKVEDQIEGLRAEIREIRRLLVEQCASKSAREAAENGETDAQISTETRADSVQQTDEQTEQEVSLFVRNNSSEIQEHTNQQTKQTRAKGRADLNVDVQENGTQMNADGRGFEEGETRDLKEMTESSRKGASNFSPPEVCPAPFLEDGANRSFPNSSLPAFTEEQDLSFRLLTAPEIGMGEQKAKEIAQRHHFGYVRRHTFAWLAELKSGDVRGVGALVHRINHRFGASEPTAEQKQSELYQRYRTSFEIEAEAKAKEDYISMLAPPAQPKSPPQPLLQPVAPDLWEQVLAKLHKEFGGGWIFKECVQPARLLGVHQGLYVIGLPDECACLQAQQYKGIIRRTLGSVIGNYQVPITLETIQVNQENRRLQAGIYEMAY